MARRGASLARKIGSSLLVFGVSIVVIAFGLSVYVDLFSSGDGGSLVWLLFGMVATIGVAFGAIGWALRAYAENAR